MRSAVSNSLHPKQELRGGESGRGSRNQVGVCACAALSRTRSLSLPLPWHPGLADG